MYLLKKCLAPLLLILLLICAVSATWLYSQVESSLPLLTGKTTIMGIENSVSIERDQQGIPTIKANNRLDLAVATGFIHAQERFFQMDLLRRNSAGELASLFGEIALDYDKSIRLHRFRERAIKIINQLPDDQLRLIKAYTTGVNEGLKSLYAKPFEYLLLRQEPVEWQAEDTVLTILSMYLDLQYKDGARERTLGLIQAKYGDEILAFLNPKGSIWDAAIDKTNYSESALPDNSMFSSLRDVVILNDSTTPTNYQSTTFPGSNNWAISGAVSETGSAIVANDMHLGIRVPNTWFRASFKYGSTTNKNLTTITGATLPGTPLMVVGSNTNIAWGFTNSYGDWNDIITLETNDEQSQYLTPDGFKDFSEHTQMIAINGKPPEKISIKETIWGPVIGLNDKQQLLVLKWVAHDEEAVNFFSQQLETAKSVEQAFLVAQQSGLPAQNIMIADKKGNIGWTIAGPIPKRSTTFGELPTSWSNGENQWQGYLLPSQYPRVINPKNNRLWTANSRVVGGEMLQKIGNGGYALGARSQQIRDALFAKDKFNEKALLAIALDDKAVFLKRWQNFLLTEVLTEQQVGTQPNWQKIKNILSEEENLNASTKSVAYRLVRNFRMNLRNSVFKKLNTQLEELNSGYSFSTIRHQIETPLWQLINEQPDSFLLETSKSWQDYFIDALNITVADMTINQSIEQATWGQQNTTNIRHPLTNGIPFIGNWLNMPATALAGDSYMPNVQGKAFGASERMVVSPGYEASGIFHMPTSQSGHPWSPYYGLGHQDWEQGRPSPFLPGPTKYTLTLLSY